MLWMAVVVYWSSNQALAHEPMSMNKDQLMSVETQHGVKHPSMRYSDAYLFQDAYYQGGDLFEQFIRFLFPISGREKRVPFLSIPYYGIKKPRYKRFEWERFESDHFDFFTYPEGQQSLQQVVKYFEEEYDRNNRIFGTQNRFEKKIPVIFFQSRRDFEQTSIVDGPIPEGLGGLTEIFGWKRVTFPFEGEQSRFEHVAKHEATHIFQIEKNARRLPLWLIEGTAETNSIYWDADAEMIIRDAYLNGFFYPIAQLWQIQGTWLMYKIGNYISNLIWDEYGEEGFYQLFENADQMNFENNLKTSLGLTVAELDQKVQAKLLLDYGHLLDQKDALDESVMVQRHRFLLDSHKNFFVTGGPSGARNALFLNYRDESIQDEEMIIRDRDFENESLESFQKGVFIADDRIVYSIKQSRRDELRVQKFSFDPEKKDIELGEVDRIKWDHIEKIEHPVWTHKNIVYFIGFESGYSNIYRANVKTGSIKKITTDNRHYDHLDYCAGSKQLVYSKEGQRDPNYIRYERHLYLMDLQGNARQITTDPDHAHLEPSFSQDCSKILFISDAPQTYNIFVYETQTQKIKQLTNARVGFRHPKWGPENTIYMNAYQQLRPSVYQIEYPNMKTVVQRSIRGEKDFSVPIPIRPPRVAISNAVISSEFNPVLDGLYEHKNHAVIQSSKKPYQATHKATLGSKMIVRTMEGVPGQDFVKENRFPFYFEIDGEQIRSLQSKMVATRGASESSLSWIQTKLQGQGIVQSWTSQDEDKVFVMVNNRMANDYEAYEDKPELTLYIYEDEANHLEELPPGPTFSLSQSVQWVSFLQNGYVLLVVADQKSGPYRIIVYDESEKKYHELSQDAAMFQVSEDRSQLIWKSAHYMFLNLMELSPKPKKIKIDEGTIKTLGLLENQNIAFVATEESKMVWIEINPENMQAIRSVKHTFDDAVIHKVVIHDDGHVAAITSPQAQTIDQTLWLWTPSENKIQKVFADKAALNSVIVRKQFITFSKEQSYIKKRKEYVFDVHDPENLKLLDEIGKVQKANAHTWVFEGHESLVLYDQQQVHATVIGELTLGFDATEDRVVFSALKNDFYALFAYDFGAQKTYLLSQEPSHMFQPILRDEELLFLQKHHGEVHVKGKAVQRESISTLDIVDMTRSTENEVVIYTVEKPVPPSSRPLHQETTVYPQMYLSRPAKKSLKLQSLAAAAAYDGDTLRLLVSGFADNLFGDKGIFVNSILLSDTKFTTIGFADLSRGYNVSGFYNERQGIVNFGANFTKDFILDRYRQVSVYTDFEIQNYDDDSSSQNDFLTPDFDGERFYISKLGGVYAFDVTVKDIHGPISGQRLYFRAETGFDIGNQEFANYDFNVDVRFYNRILPRFGLAHRLVGGTSQGNIPNIFLLGGNISFRGVGFDDLEGQNYWVLSEDLRLPVFDFAGAKFFDPVDQVLGFLTRYFDVRAGIYADVGSVWNNADPADVVYSVGYFINIPTVFGLIIRLNDGLFGEDRFGFWVGTNW